MKNNSVFGMFEDTMAADRAVDCLKDAGFSNNDISVLLPDTHGTKDFAHEKNTKAPEGAAAGVSTGVVLGGALGWLIGIGALAIPGVGPFIAAGPIMALLAGAGVGGTLGGVSGALIGMGLPEFEAKRYEGKLKSGGILLSVHSSNAEETSRAKDILKNLGAYDVATAGEACAPRHDDDKQIRQPSYESTKSSDYNQTL